jgi:hypothetical protein
MERDSNSISWSLFFNPISLMHMMQGGRAGADVTVPRLSCSYRFVGLPRANRLAQRPCLGRFTQVGCQVVPHGRRGEYCHICARSSPPWRSRVPGCPASRTPAFGRHEHQRYWIHLDLLITCLSVPLLCSLLMH